MKPSTSSISISTSISSNSKIINSKFHSFHSIPTSSSSLRHYTPLYTIKSSKEYDNTSSISLLFVLFTFLIYFVPIPLISHAIDENIPIASFSDVFDPNQFKPVCPASDNIYQILKSFANLLIGKENVVEYGPLIASVLLRLRLEICVLESFLYEAVIPFIKQKGLSWVLPIHETVETFIAGTIFAIASNFVLLGSTKIVTVLIIYMDALTGFPARIFGKGIKRFSKKDAVVNQSIGNLFRFYGELLGTVRKVTEGVDTFVGRYLVIATSLYIIFKFLHFKVFNDII